MASGVSEPVVSGKMNRVAPARWFKKLLEWFAKGETYLHYSGAEECADRLREAGFGKPTLHHPRSFGHVGVPSPEREHLVRLIEAVR